MELLPCAYFTQIIAVLVYQVEHCLRCHLSLYVLAERNGQTFCGLVTSRLNALSLLIGLGVGGG